MINRPVPVRLSERECRRLVLWLYSRRVFLGYPQSVCDKDLLDASIRTLLYDTQVMLTLPRRVRQKAGARSGIEFPSIVSAHIGD